MGSQVSQLVENEKLSWVTPHEMAPIDATVAKEQQKLLTDHFKMGSKLQLMYRKQVLFGVEYQHYWISCGIWIIEFGGGDVLSANAIKVHCEQTREGTIEAKFSMNEEVLSRMKKVRSAVCSELTKQKY